jgi:hypothetical protein
MLTAPEFVAQVRQLLAENPHLSVWGWDTEEVFVDDRLHGGQAQMITNQDRDRFTYLDHCTRDGIEPLDMGAWIAAGAPQDPRFA